MTKISESTKEKQKTKTNSQKPVADFLNQQEKKAAQSIEHILSDQTKNFQNQENIGQINKLKKRNWQYGSILEIG